MKVRWPWTLTYLRELLRYMPIRSAWKYRNLVLATGRDYDQIPRKFWLHWPIRGPVWLRPGTSDFDTFDEVIVHQVYKCVVEASPDCEFVIDLGGNIGLTARYFSAVFPSASILSVEPSGNNCQMYRRNMACVPSSRWTLKEAAVWSSDGSVRLSKPGNGEYNALSVSDEDSIHGDVVRAVSLPTLLAKSGFPRIDLLKIDIEGAEAELFSSNTDWLYNIRTMAVEFHGDSRKRSRFDSVIASRGFTLLESNPHTTIATRNHYVFGKC